MFCTFVTLMVIVVFPSTHSFIKASSPHLNILLIVPLMILPWDNLLDDINYSVLNLNISPSTMSAFCQVSFYNTEILALSSFKLCSCVSLDLSHNIYMHVYVHSRVTYTLFAAGQMDALSTTDSVLCYLACKEPACLPNFS